MRTSDHRRPIHLSCRESLAIERRQEAANSCALDIDCSLPLSHYSYKDFPHLIIFVPCAEATA